LKDKLISAIVPTSKKGNGWTKSIVTVVVSAVLTAFFGFIAFLGYQVISLKDTLAECRLEDARKYYEQQKELALLRLTVDAMSGKVTKLELMLEERRNEKSGSGVSNTIDRSGNRLGLDPFFVDVGIVTNGISDEDHQQDSRAVQ